MKPAELIECGELMVQKTLTPEEGARLVELQRRAKLELPHDDSSTPDVDEGDTEVVREQKRKVACQQRAHDFLEAVKAEVPEVLELVLRGVTAALLKR